MSPKGDFHEDFSREQGIPGASNRSVGLLFATVCGVVALAPLRLGGEIHTWLLAVAAALLGASLFAPRLLHPVNRAWTKLGVLLHRVSNPVLLGIVFFLIVTPMAVVMRLRGRDPLRRKLDAGARTYWMERQMAEPETMTRQF